MEIYDTDLTIANVCNQKNIRITVISNITIDPYFVDGINKAFREANSIVSVKYIGLSEFVSSIEMALDLDTDLIIMLPFFDLIYQEMLVTQELCINKEKQAAYIIDYFQNIYSRIRANASALVLWFGLEDYFTKLDNVMGNTSYYDRLTEIINAVFSSFSYDDFVYIDTKRIIAKVGMDNAYNIKNMYRWNSPYSASMIDHICEEVYKQYAIFIGNTKKCLVLDCDNVLWGGVLSDDGIENIHLSSDGFGRMYRDFQRFVLELYKHGVILALCSKNDLEEVLSVFREHSSMVLKEEHIACLGVNWNDKPTNIKEISQTLNIGLDSLVFVDDSPEEISAVKTLFPEVTTILFHRDMDFRQFSCFNLKKVVNMCDVEKRYETYRTDQKREKMKSQFEDCESYIKALDVRTEIHKVTPIEYSRVSELTYRTNKFTNGMRLTVLEIAKIVEENMIEMYSVHVSDKFSDLGLVGVFAVNENVIELFSLSCRALGRNVERKMLAYIGSQWNIKNVYFQSTGKNDAFKTMLENCLNIYEQDFITHKLF